MAMRSGAFPVNAFLDNSGKPATVNGPYWAQVLSNRLGYGVTNGEPYSFNGCGDPAACVFPGGVIPARAFAPTTNPLLKYYSSAEYRRQHLDQRGAESHTQRRQGRTAGRRAEQENGKLVYLLRLRRFDGHNSVRIR